MKLEMKSNRFNDKDSLLSGSNCFACKSLSQTENKWRVWSYATEVAIIDMDSKTYRLLPGWDYSQTTVRHIDSILDYFKVPHGRGRHQLAAHGKVAL